jgi:LmbE family N-acetylglucosaminyl deacetylase
VKRLHLGQPKRVLIVAPHSDDETIGAYGAMLTLCRRGCDVRVLIVTDGAGSHRGSARWPTARLVAERRREARRALRLIGIAAGHITFLALPDGHLGPDHARPIKRAIRRVKGLDLIVGPAAIDAHPDHRATAVAIAGARLPGVRRLDYRVWGAGRRRAQALPLGGLRNAKRAAIKHYRTQMGAIRDDPTGFAIARHELHAFSRATEFYGEAKPCSRSR